MIGSDYLPVFIIPFSGGFILNPIKLVVPLSCRLILVPTFVIIVRSKKKKFILTIIAAVDKT